jgi:hypothetical protein
MAVTISGSTGIDKVVDGSIAAVDLAANAVTTAKIADDAITLAKMAPGTDGNLITYDASQNPAYVATGTAGQLLTSAGTGAPPTFTTVSSGGLTQLASQATTSGTSIVFSGLNLSTYKFLYICQNGVGWAADTAGIQRLTPNGGSFVRWAGGGSAVPGYYGLTFVDLSTGIGSGTTVSATPAAIIHAGGAFTTFVNTGISASTTSLTFGTDGNVAFNKGNMKLYGLK